MPSGNRAAPRDGKTVLGGELVKVVPQTDHLRRFAWRENLRVCELDLLASRIRPFEHIAGMNDNRLALQHAKA